MSVLCTTPRSFCYHHPIVSKIENLSSYYESESLDYVGVSYSLMGLFLPWILENIKPRTLIIMRDIKDVYASMDKIGLNTDFIGPLRDTLLKFVDHPLVKLVPFPSLDNELIVGKIFAHLMPGNDFDVSRFRQVSQLNVQMDVKKGVALFKKKQADMEQLMQSIFPGIEVDYDLLETL